MGDMINNRMDIPKRMTTGNTILCQKDPGKGNAVDNYWPILCLPLMWKLVTILICSVYEYLNVVSATLLLVCFLSLKDTTCETKKNVFYFTLKDVFVLEIIKF